MKNAYRYLTVIFAFLALVACQPADQQSPGNHQFASIDTTVMSRGVAVPVTFVHPLAANGDSYPLVVMAHGFGGSRNETGVFRTIAEELAVRGVASIRMDFPGSGDSTEPFSNNNLTNMLEDIEASRNHAIAQPQVDSDRVGLFGWSMGGRLVVLAAAQDASYKAIATWAPAARNGAGAMTNSFGGADGWNEYKALATKNGSVAYKTFWGLELELGLQFFTDLEQSMALDAAHEIARPLLVLYGDLDDVVLPEVSEALIEAATKSPDVVRHVIEGADHGLGVFSDEPEITQEAVSTTVDFLSSRL